MRLALKWGGRGLIAQHPDAKAIPKTRLRIQALLRTIRAGLAGTPKS